MSDITIDYDSINEAFKLVQEAHDDHFEGAVPSEALSLDLFIQMTIKEMINIPEILISKSNASFTAGLLFGIQGDLMRGIDKFGLFVKDPDPHNSK